MAVAFNSESFLLKEGFIKYGTVATPTATQTGNTDPLTLAGWAETGTLGWFKQGTLSLPIDRTYATFKAGTPAIKVRIDPIESAWSVMSENAQFDIDALELMWNLNRITGAVADILEIGSDMPALQGYAFLWETQLVGPGGTPTEIKALMYNGLMTLESLGFRLTGTEHATYSFKAEATPHPDFTSPLTYSQAIHSYGLFWAVV